MAKYIPDSYLYRAIGADIEGRCGRCAQSRSDCMCHSLSRMDICGILEDAATTDVVEVVRCKNCKHRRKITWANGTDNWECVNDSGDPYEQSRHAEDDDWFCADGEAK